MICIFLIGASGSGKSTLCNQLNQFYRMLGQSTITINLDIANYLSQAYTIDVNQLVQLQDVMEEYQLGPNGAIVYAIEFIHTNIQWLHQQIKIHTQKTHQEQTIYLLIDLPGQIELYLNNEALKKIIHELIHQHSLNACVLELFQCTFLHEISHYLSLCMMSLVTMINLQLPHINLLSKIDLLQGHCPALGMLNDYFTLSSMKQMVNQLSSQNNQLYNQLAKVIDTYGQVSFLPYSISIPSLINNLILEIQRTVGTLQISRMKPQFHSLIKEQQQPYYFEKLITNLQLQLFNHDDKDTDQILKNIVKDNP